MPSGLTLPSPPVRAAIVLTAVTTSHQVKRRAGVSGENTRGRGKKDGEGAKKVRGGERGGEEEGGDGGEGGGAAGASSGDSPVSAASLICSTSRVQCLSHRQPSLTCFPSCSACKMKAGAVLMVDARSYRCRMLTCASNTVETTPHSKSPPPNPQGWCLGITLC